MDEENFKKLLMEKKEIFNKKVGDFDKKVNKNEKI